MAQPFLQIVLVAIGSAFGGVSRWMVHLAVGRWLGTEYPFGTLIINVSGSFFLGFLMSFLSESPSNGSTSLIGREELRLAIATGFIGAFTTFSTFEWESNTLLREGKSFAANTYMVGSLVLGLLAVRCGILFSNFLKV